MYFSLGFLRYVYGIQMLPSFVEILARQDVRAPFPAHVPLKVEEISFLSTCWKGVPDVPIMCSLVTEACVSFNLRVLVTR